MMKIGIVAQMISACIGRFASLDNGVASVRHPEFQGAYRGHPGSKKGASHKRSKFATGQKAASQYANRYNIWKA